MKGKMSGEKMGVDCPTVPKEMRAGSGMGKEDRKTGTGKKKGK